MLCKETIQPSHKLFIKETQWGNRTNLSTFSLNFTIVGICFQSYICLFGGKLRATEANIALYTW